MTKIKPYVEPSYKERQQLAIEFLREQCRQAHNDGDGLLVNHLCSVALKNVIKWQKSEKCHINVFQIYWAIVFSLYWILDEYMLESCKELLKNLVLDHEDKKDLTRILEQGIYLVEQSLMENP